METFLYDVLEKSHITILRAKFDCTEPFWDKAFERNNQLYHNRIYLITKGSAHFTLTNGDFTAKAGDLCFMPGNTLLSRYEIEPMEMYYIHFLFDSEINDLFSFFTPLNRVKPSENILSFFHFIIENLNSSNPMTKLKISTYSKLILYEFFQNAKWPSAGKMRFLDILHYIDQNLSEKLCVKDLADRMYLSPIYFSNQFTKTFGIPPQEYIIQKKLQRAKILLINSRVPIKAISEQTGFESQLYFSRVFKAKIGYSPSMYRQLMLQ